MLALEKAFEESKRLGKRPRAVIVSIYMTKRKWTRSWRCVKHTMYQSLRMRQSLGALYKGEKAAQWAGSVSIRLMEIKSLQHQAAECLGK
ncbi:hypothetical protein ACEQPO_25465 [Bacillus sp. SL00103]